MITKFGKRFITSYLANGLSFNKKDLAIGIGSTAVTANDTDMEFEFYRSGVFLGSTDIQTSTSSGQTTYAVVYKTTLPVDVEGIIKEIGLFPTTNLSNTDYSSRYISTFEDVTLWADSSGNQPTTVSTPAPQIGSSYFQVTASAGQTKYYSINTQFDMSGYGINDKMSIAFNQSDTNLDYVYVKFYSSSTAYKEVRFAGALSTGNKILKVSMDSVFNSTYTSTDLVDFSSIIKIEVGAKAKTSACTVLLDALKIDDNNTYNSQYGLISRSVLTDPIVKKLGVEMDIEYKINLGFL